MFDLDRLAASIAPVLTACAHDFRDDLIGDMIVQLRRRHHELGEVDIAALVEAVKARIEPGNSGFRRPPMEY